ncbi:MAG: hypothetical protein KDJ99_25675 [Candidatus Competibacteraceae bacterium]|nr:hypothetical protein [Candidatus Competibacteraceae bacterium]
MNKFVVMMASVLVTASLLGQTTTSQAYAPPVVAKMLSPEQKQILFDSSHPSYSARISQQALLELGEKAYWRSCESCHGVVPEALPYQDRIQFGRVVLNGQGNMPGLGFKLELLEVEAIRQYLAYSAQ